MERGSGCNDGQRSYPFVLCIFLHAFLRRGGDYSFLLVSREEEEEEEEKEEEDSGDRRRRSGRINGGPWG